MQRMTFFTKKKKSINGAIIKQGRTNINLRFYPINVRLAMNIIPTKIDKNCINNYT